ncbi:MAG: ATP-binding cassette domain-containing protein [Thermostichales cyanobacterium BF4_bins_65]
MIMGLWGSGKSTPLITPTQGELRIDRHNLLQLSPQQLRQFRRQHLGMVFQQFALFPHRTVLENVEYSLKIQGIPKGWRRKP